LVKGQRVRCSLGESVVFGTFEAWVDFGGRSTPYHRVIVDGDLVPWAFTPHWKVELVEEPEPPVGTVVLDQEGDAWQLTKHGWRCIYSDESAFATLDDLDRDWGPLTLLEVAR
jgi:hypothetical protein